MSIANLHQDKIGTRHEKLMLQTGEILAGLIKQLQDGINQDFACSVTQPGESKFYCSVSEDGTHLIINNLRLKDGRYIDAEIKLEKLLALPKS